MTYQPNPDAPIASEQHPELYERMCKARAFIEQVLSAYVKARKANGMTRPTDVELYYLLDELDSDIDNDLAIDNERCLSSLGEGYLLNYDEQIKLIEENWNGK